MIEEDTIKLLKECNSGIKMGVTSINDILPEVQDRNFAALLTDSKKEHEKLGNETHQMLTDFGDDGKSPHAMAEGMAKMKTEFKMTLNGGDTTAADLITDGCNMGVKSLNRYLNKYKAADEKSKDIAKRLIHIESRLAEDVAQYL